MSDRTLAKVGAALPCVVLLLGAGIYAVALGAIGVTFNATPLIIGLIAVVAGLAGPRRHLIPVGLALAGWGSGVLLAAEVRSLQDRTTPLYVVGFGAGLVLVRLVAPHSQRGSWLTSAAIAVLVSGLFYLAAFDVDQLGRWPAWALALVAWAVWELRPASDPGGTSA